MTDNQTGFLVPLLKRTSGYMKCISPMRWFACFIPNLRNPSANATETYVLICLMIELAIGLAFLSPISQLSIVGWLFGVLAVLRIVEIMGRTIDVTDVIARPARWYWAE